MGTRADRLSSLATQVSRPDPFGSSGTVAAGSPLWFDELLSEKQVYERFGRLLADGELRRARQTGRIAFVKGAPGYYYHPTDVAAYLEAKRNPCLNHEASNTEAFGSRRSMALAPITPAGMTPPDEEQLASLLARKNSTKLRGD